MGTLHYNSQGMYAEDGKDIQQYMRHQAPNERIHNENVIYPIQKQQYKSRAKREYIDLEENSKQREIENESKQLTSIFVELMSIINAQSKIFEKGMNGAYFNNSKEPSQSQIIQSGRLQNKRKTYKLLKPHLYPNSFLKLKMLPHKKDQSVVSLQERASEIQKKMSSYIRESNYKILEVQNQRKKLYENYQKYMTYSIHASEDEEEMEPKSASIHKQKIRIFQPTLSECSAAYSSLNAHIRRKFSIQRCFQMSIEKPSKNLQCFPQFQYQYRSNYEVLAITKQNLPKKPNEVIEIMQD